MESLAFALLLFCVYFVTACCFLYKPNQSLNSEQFSLLLREAGEETTPSAPPAPSALFVDQPITMTEALSVEFDPEPEVEIIATALAVKSLCEAQLPLHPSDS